MDPSEAVKTLLPRLPLIIKVMVSQFLGLGETSSKWDLRTALTVNILRSILNDSSNSGMTLTKMQKGSMKDPGIKGKMWISKVTIPAPQEDGIREALFKAIESLKEPGSPTGGYQEPELRAVEGEWTGYRNGASKDSPELKVTEEQKYAEMMKEVGEPTTILYFHGGAHFLMDPCTHRKVTTKLAKLTGGRCLSIRYRLAPQNPFPAGLLDALVSYFNLLYPPVGALHTPVQPQHIVFAGDSAGGNICFALLQTLLEFRRQNLKIMWNGAEREIPLPAGIAGASPWFDVTHSSPSWENCKYDYLPCRKVGEPSELNFHKDDAWPSNPPRNNLYAEDALLCHPLVSPLAAKSWVGSPPIHINVGQELLADENLFVAMKMAKEGVTVIFDHYEAMPHCFAMIIEGTNVSRKCFGKMGYFINAAVVKAPFMKPDTLVTKGTLIVAKTNKEKELDIMNLTKDTEEVVLGRMHQIVEWSNRKVPETMISSSKL